MCLCLCVVCIYVGFTHKKVELSHDEKKNFLFLLNTCENKKEENVIVSVLSFLSFARNKKKGEKKVEQFGTHTKTHLWMRSTFKKERIIESNVQKKKKNNNVIGGFFSIGPFKTIHSSLKSVAFD